jgi:DNA polymerase I-like protein with 3'-5' exonuclease and polymerase domains
VKYENAYNLGDELVYCSGTYVTLDFETDTSHGDFGHPVHPKNGMLLACWKDIHGVKKHVWGDEFSLSALLADIEEADFIVAHNAKYELGWLQRAGLDLHDVKVFCTKLAEYVLLGNRAAPCKPTGLARRSTSLNDCCLRRGWGQKDPIVDKMMKYGINPIFIPRRWLKGRCEQDVETTERLFLDQRRLLVDSERDGVLYTRCLFTPVLASMELEGMALDSERVEEVYNDACKDLAKLTAEMEGITGGINWKSPKQVASFLYGEPEDGGLGFQELKRRDGTPIRTPSKRPKTDQATVASLKATSARQREFVSVRRQLGKVDAALSKALRFFQGVCQELEGTFYAQFNQTKTATHRLSSSGHYTWFEMFQDSMTAQMQNLARIFKRLFTAKNKGWYIMEIDGSQLEFRVAADLGKDEQAIQDINDPDFDAHIFSASEILGVPYEELLQQYRDGDKHAKSARTAAKAHTFKPLYGGESGTKAEKRYYKAFKERYSGIATAQEAWVEEVLREKRLITPWGMRYYWPRAKRGRDGYVNVKSNVYNYPVQAFATAEIIPIAVTALWHRLRDCDGVRFINTVHDSVILEVHPDAVDRVRAEGINAFGIDVYNYLEDVYDYSFTVPLGCGITLGTHWSEGDEESYNIWPNGTVETAL